MRFRTLAFAAAAAVATPALAVAALQLPGAEDPSRITGGTYVTDPGHTLVGWQVNHFGFNDYFGIFGDATGTLTIDPKNPSAAKVDISVPVAKVTTASAGLTQHLLKAPEAGKQPDFFGPNPANARFVSTKVDVNGNSAKITGNLTLNGTTKPVVLDAKFTGAGANPMSKKETVGFEATTTIQRSAYGIAYGIPVVSDEVELDITVAFEKQ